MPAITERGSLEWRSSSPAGTSRSRSISGCTSPRRSSGSERYDHKIVGLEVELFHERNRRQLKNCQRVEITGRGCGPVARAEACAQDFYSALDAAIAKLEARLRRSHDRRRITARRSTVLVGRGGQTMLLDAPPDVDVPGPRDSVDGAWIPTSTASSTGSGRDARRSGRRPRVMDDPTAELDDDAEPTSTVRARSCDARCTPHTR